VVTTKSFRNIIICFLVFFFFLLTEIICDVIGVTISGVRLRVM
jgi:hypothetical protein